jgi:guanylate kinase
MPELVMSISYTTRKPRKGEENARDYVFVSKEEFLKAREEGLFLEWAEVHGRLYGTPRDYLERRIENGDDTVLDIDVQGAELIRAAIPDAVLVLLMPPSLDELERRLRGRGSDSAEDIRIRLDNAIAEFERNSMFDYFVVNEDLEKAVESLEAIIRAERRRADRLKR